MTWFKLSDQFYDHPKVMQAGNSAVGLWVRCGTYSAQKLLDGRIPKATAHLFGSKRDVERLLKTGLWIDVEGSYWIPNFLEYNPSAEKVRADRVAALERQTSWRDKHRNNSVTNSEVTP
jgi:hypothetical protein